MAIYEVSKNTTRDDYRGIPLSRRRTQHPRRPRAPPLQPERRNANARHVIADGHGDIVIEAEPNVTNAIRITRVWYEPGRFMSTGAHQFLNGGTIAAGPSVQRPVGHIPVPQDRPVPVI
jgi:hypothetical protein